MKHVEKIANELKDDEKIAVFANDPIEYDFSVISFKELCKAIAKKLAEDGAIPMQGD